MRTRLAILALTSILLFSGCGSFRGGQASPDALLQRGQDEYRTEHFKEAVGDLEASAEGFLSPEMKRKYLETGRLESLPRFETALVYLTMAYSKTGREQDAHDTILRLADAERIQLVYATLPLGSDALEFESLASTRSPAIALSANAALAQLRSGSTSQAPVAAPAAGEPTQPPEREALLRMIEKGSASARAQDEQEAQQRFAADRAAAQKASDERLAAERAAASRAAEEMRRAAAERALQDRIEAAEAEARSSQSSRLRQAEVAVNAGRVDYANDLYVSAANAPGVSREAIAAAATGLYRTGDYTQAIAVFRRLAPFRRGEEDLRYYNAVSLYESGHFEQARKELACALPYIQITRDVSRYRTKIEKTR